MAQVLFDPLKPRDRKIVRDILTKIEGIGDPVVVDGIEPRAQRRRIRRKNAFTRWTQADVAFVKEHAGKWYLHRIARKLGRSKASVQTLAGRLALSIRRRRKHVRLVRRRRAA
jgi:hypothetical protein